MSRNTVTTNSQRKRIAVFGAGIAGLSAAHELANLGYSISVYEANSEAGGFFRSARVKNDNGMPSEYSWHGIGPWYHNVFDLMKQIPFDKSGSVYDRALSKPIAFGVVPDNTGSAFSDVEVFNYSKSFRMTNLDKLALGWVMLKIWTSHRRSDEQYSRHNAAAYWKPYMTERGWKTWRATFGPWIGSDWANASLHHVGLFFRRNMFAGPAGALRQDGRKKTWVHNSKNGWRLLRGPSNEWWFDKWVTHLKNKRVKFFWNSTLLKLNYDGSRITSAELASGEVVHADYFVLATTPFAAADVLKRTPKLAKLGQLNLFSPLIQDGPHTSLIQDSFC